MKNKILAAAVVAATIAIAASLLAGAQMLPLPALVPIFLRWLAILLIAAYATSRRSLTTWIFVGLLAGAEFGHDWPSVAVNLQLLGTIFLRLIKVIIAPLLFGFLRPQQRKRSMFRRTRRRNSSRIFFRRTLRNRLLKAKFCKSWCTACFL